MPSQEIVFEKFEENKLKNSMDGEREGDITEPSTF